MTIEQLIEDYDKKEDNLTFKIRKQILERVWSYLWYKYAENGGIKDKNIQYAITILQDRYNYQHHYTKGF